MPNGLSRTRLLGLAIALFLIWTHLSAPVQDLIGMPRQIRIVEGEQLELSLPPLLRLDARATQAGLMLNGEAIPLSSWTSTVGPIQLSSHQSGNYEVSLRLFGWLPYRQVWVDVIPALEVYPSGEAIGVLIRQSGVMVVRQEPVQEERGQSFPAAEAGVRIGDMITHINGRPIPTKEFLAEQIHTWKPGDEDLRLRVVRRQEVLHIAIRPTYDRLLRQNMIGLWVRDGASGIGTLTFYEPESERYGALGHMVADADTGQPYPIGEGRIVRAAVAGIRPGKQGAPGEKQGSFINSGDPLGAIDRNTPVGIFGELNSPPSSLFREPVPVGLTGEIEEGDADIVTVIEGRKLERFQIKIERVSRQEQPNGHSMIVRIVDPKLLQLTGGIIQGMSGSPILQNGKWIGAVTHVFVNDPTRGYAVSAEWMLEQSGILEQIGQASPTARTAAAVHS